MATYNIVENLTMCTADVDNPVDFTERNSVEKKLSYIIPDTNTNLNTLSLNKQTLNVYTGVVTPWSLSEGALSQPSLDMYGLGFTTTGGLYQTDSIDSIIDGSYYIITKHCIQSIFGASYMKINNTDGNFIPNPNAFDFDSEAPNYNQIYSTYLVDFVNNEKLSISLFAYGFSTLQSDLEFVLLQDSLIEWTNQELTDLQKINIIEEAYKLMLIAEADGEDERFTPYLIPDTAELNYMANEGYTITEEDITVTNADNDITLLENNTEAKIVISNVVDNVNVEITALETFDIVVDNINCVADETNPTTIRVTETGVLKFESNTDFPYNSFLVNVTNADYTVELDEDYKGATITLENPTETVAVQIQAYISSSVNETYKVINGVLYCIFNNRNKCRWNLRWVKKNDIKPYV